MDLSFLFGGGGPSVGGLMKKQSQQVERSNRLADLLVSKYNENARAGAYDPNQRLDQLKADHEYSSGIQTGNAAAAARTMGYRPGDSEPLHALKAIGRNSELDYDRMADQIRTDAQGREMNDLLSTSGTAAGIYSNGASIYGDQVRTAMEQKQQQGQGLAGLLGAVMPFLGPVGMGASALTKGVGPTATSMRNPRDFWKR